jgi:hypothetical protein
LEVWGVEVALALPGDTDLFLENSEDVFDCVAIKVGRRIGRLRMARIVQ